MPRQVRKQISKLSISPGELLSDQVTTNEIKIILRELAKVDGITGDVVELGCYIGTTSVFLAKYLRDTDKKLYVYDSFAGLPPKTVHDESPAGLQFKTGELLATKKLLIKNFKQANLPLPNIKKAWFCDLLPSDMPEQISFAFLDGDYYNSVMDSLKLVWPKLVAGAVVVVDDYVNEALPGAAKAVDEWLRIHPAKLRIEASLAILQVDK